MQRSPTWDVALKGYIDTVMDRPFQWGEHDCALFAAGAVMAMTGIDPAATYRGQYNSQTGAAKALREHGAGTLLREVKSWFRAKPILHAQRGDLVMRDRTSIGVCVGQFSYFVGTDDLGSGLQRDGLIWFPTRELAYAFEVPFSSPE